MELLGIQDATTMRQHKNGTIVWRLPIKNNHFPTSYIEVASFSTGYVRNQNSGYSNYQLNKRCESEPEYYNINPPHKEPLYRKFTTRTCKLIPIEIDRLEYLISYCLKNYFIKRANQVVEGKYVSQWYHDHMLENANSPTVTRNLKKISELESDVRKLETKSKDTFFSYEQTLLENKELKDRIYELESQVDVADDKLVNSKDYTTDLKAQLHMVQEELSATKVRQDVSVIVNGHRYKVL
jgi:hypothetical protein